MEDKEHLKPRPDTTGLLEHQLIGRKEKTWGSNRHKNEETRDGKDTG